MPKSKVVSVFFTAKLTTKQLLLIAFVFNSLIYMIFYHEWLTGEINLLGAPDTVIPFYSSFYMTNSISNMNLTSWNFYNQTDFAYSHMSTGWWTTSGLVTAIISITANYFFEINGQNFVQIHLMILIVCQLFLRLIGLILLMKKFQLKNTTIIITTCLVSPIVFSKFSLSFHVSIIYSTIFLLVYLIEDLRHNFSFNSISKFIVFAVAIVFQEPLFAIAYLGQIIFCYIILQYIRNVKDINDRVKQLFQQLNPRMFKPQLSFSFAQVANYICIITTIFLFYIFSKSINVNYFFTDNRAQTPTINLQTLKILVGTHWSEDFSKILTTSSTGMVSGWPFMGVTLVFFSILGLLNRCNRRITSLKILVIMFIVMQFTINKSDLTDKWGILDLPILILKLLGAVLRFFLYLTFPFSFLFRSGTMLVWLIASILIIFFAIGLEKFICQFSQRSISKKNLMQILMVLVFLLILNYSIYVLLTICIGLLVSFFLHFKQKKNIIPKHVSRYIMLTSISLFLVFDLALSAVDAEISEYSGSKLLPNSFVFEEYSTPYFVPQYASPFSKLSFNVVSLGVSPDVIPVSRAPLLSVYEDSNYFGPNELNSYFYQTTYMGDYRSNSYYQNKHILFAKYNGLPKLGYVPTAIQDSNANRPDSLSEAITNKLEIGKIIKVAKNVNGSYLYVFECRCNASNLRSSFDPKFNTVFFEIDGEKYYPVKGKPVSEKSFDFGNFYSEKLTFISRIKPTSIGSANLHLFSSNGILNEKNAFLKSEISAGGIKIDNVTKNASSVTFAIPFQSGWRIYPVGNVSLHSSNGWLKVDNLESRIYHLEFNPYFPFPYYLPFLLLLWVSFILFCVPFKLLSSKLQA